MKKSDLILSIFAVLIVSGLVARGMHLLISGTLPTYVQTSAK